MRVAGEETACTRNHLVNGGPISSNALLILFFRSFPTDSQTRGLQNIASDPLACWTITILFFKTSTYNQFLFLPLKKTIIYFISFFLIFFFVFTFKLRLQPHVLKMFFTCSSAKRYCFSRYTSMLWLSYLCRDGCVLFAVIIGKGVKSQFSFFF